MTEDKRFGITSEYEDNILLITVNDEPYNIYEVLELLQELYKESEELKHHLSELQGQNEILTKENEKLKERVKQLELNQKVLKKIYKTFYKPRGIKYD